MNKRDFLRYAALSIPMSALANNNKDKQIERIDFVTPEMFGAIGDGITDDSICFQKMIDYAIKHSIKIFLYNNYHITVTLNFYGQYTTNYRLSMYGISDKATIKFSGSGICLNVGSFGIDFEGFNIISESISQNGSIALKVSGSNGSIKNLNISGFWKISYWLIDFSNSYVEHCKDFGYKDNIQGTSWLINSCVNTTFNANYTVYRDYGYQLDPPNLVESHEINKATIQNYKRKINWGCEGLNFHSIKTIWCNNGIYSRGICISFNSCVIDLCHKTIIRWYAEVSLSNCWLAMSKVSSKDKLVISNDKVSTIVSFVNNHLSFNVRGNKHHALITANVGVFIGNIADGIDVKIKKNKTQDIGNIAINDTVWS
uniref:hypothetical protein n=1 Tax=Pluralibacter gergoviae TaxID=61647 RepID=UPI0011137FA4|nr:hypothetical protein [Pluralibacter gergoviae]